MPLTEILRKELLYWAGLNEEVLTYETYLIKLELRLVYVGATKRLLADELT